MNTYLNHQPDSALTKHLYDCQSIFYKAAERSPTPERVVKKNVIGPIFTLSVSLISHAEAVCRAAWICFLILREVFCQINESDLEDQKHKFSEAFSQSIKSFIALFYLAILHHQIQSFSEAEPKQQETIYSPLSTPKTATLSDPVQQIEEMAPSALPPLPTDPSRIRFMNRPPQHIEQALVVEDHFVEPQEEPFEEIHHSSAESSEFEEANLEPAEEKRREADPESSEPSFAFPESEPEDEAPNVSAHQEPPRVADLDDEEEKEPFRLSEEELARIQFEEEKKRVRKAFAREQSMMLTPRTVGQSLFEELRDADGGLRAGGTQIGYLTGPENLYNDPKWKFFEGQLHSYRLGGCHFANVPQGLPGQHLATELSLEIQNQSIKAPLFAILDPQIGFRATDFLMQHLPQTLAQHLQEQNSRGLTQAGIWNAISASFLTLQEAFISKYRHTKISPEDRAVVADQGCSATVAFILNGALWTAQLGTSKALLHNGVIGVQLTETPDPTNPKYRDLVRKLGGEIDDNGLVDGRLKMATAFGRYDLKGAISSKPIITTYSLDMIKEPARLLIGNEHLFKITGTGIMAGFMRTQVKLEPRSLAHDLVYSVHEANRALAKNHPLSCLIVDLNAVAPPKKAAEPRSPNDDWVIADDEENF